MAFSRYESTIRFKNSKELYRKHFEKRDVNYIKQYGSSKYRYPSEEEMSSLSITSRVWKRGDRLYKYANEYYGDSEFWWVIAWFNKTPSEAMIQLGDVVSVPFPLERAVELMGL